MGGLRKTRGLSARTEKASAQRQHEISPAGRASRPELARPVHRSVLESIATRSAQIKTSNQRSLELVPSMRADTRKSLGTLVSRSPSEPFEWTSHPTCFVLPPLLPLRLTVGILRIWPMPCSITQTRGDRDHYNRATSIRGLGCAGCDGLVLVTLQSRPGRTLLHDCDAVGVRGVVLALWDPLPAWSPDFFSARYRPLVEYVRKGKSAQRATGRFAPGSNYRR